MSRSTVEGEGSLPIQSRNNAKEVPFTQHLSNRALNRGAAGSKTELALRVKSVCINVSTHPCTGACMASWDHSGMNALTLLFSKDTSGLCTLHFLDCFLIVFLPTRSCVLFIFGTLFYFTWNHGWKKSLDFKQIFTSISKLKITLNFCEYPTPIHTQRHNQNFNLPMDSFSNGQ